MKDMKMRTRLIAGFAVIGLLILIMGIISYNVLASSDADTMKEQIILVVLLIMTLGFSIFLSVNILRNIRLHQFTYSRQKIPKCRNMIGNYSLWNNSRPLNDERSTDTSFI